MYYGNLYVTERTSRLLPAWDCTGHKGPRKWYNMNINLSICKEKFFWRQGSHTTAPQPPPPRSGHTQKMGHGAATFTTWCWCTSASLWQLPWNFLPILSCHVQPWHNRDSNPDFVSGMGQRGDPDPLPTQPPTRDCWRSENWGMCFLKGREQRWHLDGKDGTDAGSDLLHTPTATTAPSTPSSPNKWKAAFC